MLYTRAQFLMMLSALVIVMVNQILKVVMKRTSHSACTRIVARARQ